MINDKLQEYTTYWVIYNHNVYKKQYTVLPKIVRQKVDKIVDEFFINGPTTKNEKLFGMDKCRKIRVGKYRMLYTEPDGNNIIRICKIGHRTSVYKMMGGGTKKHKNHKYK